MIFINKTKKLFLISLILLSSSCSGGGGSNDSDSNSGCNLKVFNGTQCEGTAKSVVLLVLKNRAGDALASCSGTVISPKAILTAAHCVTPSELDIRNVDVYVDGKIINSSNLKRHPSYSPASTLNPFDVGLVILPQRVTTAAIPIRASRLASRGEDIRIFGYGLDESQTSLFEQEVFDKGPKVGNLNVTLAIEGVFFCGSEDQGACSGDSGGPAVDDNAAQIVGIASAAVTKQCGPSLLTAEQIAELNGGTPLTNDELEALKPLSPDGGKHYAVNAYVDTGSNAVIDFIRDNVPDVVIQ
jgi:Trypsin